MRSSRDSTIRVWPASNEFISFEMVRRDRPAPWYWHLILWRSHPQQKQDTSAFHLRCMFPTRWGVSSVKSLNTIKLNVNRRSYVHVVARRAMRTNHVPKANIVLTAKEITQHKYNKSNQREIYHIPKPESGSLLFKIPQHQHQHMQTNSKLQHAPLRHKWLCSFILTIICRLK